MEPKLDIQNELLKTSSNTLGVIRNRLVPQVTALKRGSSSLDAVMNNFHTIQTLFGIGGVSFHAVEDKVKELNALRARLECIIKVTRDPMCDLCELNDQVTLTSFCTKTAPCCRKLLCLKCIHSINVQLCTAIRDASVSHTGLRLNCTMKCPFCNSVSLCRGIYVSELDLYSANIAYTDLTGDDGEGETEDEGDFIPGMVTQL